MLEPNNDMIQGPHNYNMDGTAQDNHSFLDIVSRYKEPIDEDKLDELADEYSKYEVLNDARFYSTAINAYKAGYRKAKEE